MKGSFLFTCEHASAAVPAYCKSAFSTVAARADLASHRGIDFFAEMAASILSEKLKAKCFKGQWSRLCIDLNRSPHHRNLYSSYAMAMPADLRKTLLEYYNNYRNSVIQEISRLVEGRHPVIHISVHSFTPIWEGKPRQCDLGVLYDPGRPEEKQFALGMQESLQVNGYRVRRNYPYRGNADGLTTTLRKLFQPDQYLGIELEFNQADPDTIVKMLDPLSAYLKRK